MLGIDFAPLHVPWERRLQTIWVVWYVLMMLFLPVIGPIVLLLVLNTALWWIPAGMLIYFVYDTKLKKSSRQGGSQSSIIRNSSHFKYIRDYFPVALVKTAALDPTKNYIMGSHPHGIMGFSSVINFGSEATGFSKLFPGITPHLCTLDAGHSIPFLRVFIMWMGLCQVSADSIRWIINQPDHVGQEGHAAIIILGGAEEALEAKPGNFKLILKHRKGFVRLAIEAGSPLVPVFSFGENDLYNQADNPRESYLRAFQDKIKQVFGFSPPVIYGRGIFNYNFGMLPHRRPIATIVGAPIDVPKIPFPNADIVDEYHAIYMNSLSRLFDEHKCNYGIDENKHLEFV